MAVRFFVVLLPVRDLLLVAKLLFVAAMLAVPFGTGAVDRFNHATKVECRGMNSGGSSSDEQAIAEHLTGASRDRQHCVLAGH
jgi:hypothetical protein